jgi:TolB protein
MSRLLALAALVLAAPTAHAQQRVYIDVGAPNFRPLPIAVAPFLAEPEARGEAETASAVLHNDLALSGLFDVLDPRGFLADPSEGLTAPTIRFARWVDVGAEGLVKASVRRTPAGLEGDLRLFEVRAGREALRAVHRVAAGEARDLGHRFADALVEHYTREPGVFRTRIAAVRRRGDVRELVLLDADGQNLRVLLSEKALLLLPAWRPDGREILVTSYRGGRPGLWIFRLADSSFRQIPTPGDAAMGGAFSPDGRRIAFAAMEGENADVWVMEADGSHPRRLTRDPAIDVSPAWSPDGKRISFVSARAGSPQIYTMNPDGSEPRRLTFQGNYNQTPDWSPRGDLIAFTARDERRAFDVFVLEPESGKIRRITQDQGFTNEEPAFAPNGRLLAFVTDRNGRPELVVSDPTGERQTVVTRGAGELLTPTWGPLVR